MDLKKVLHMRGGSGEISYSQSAYVAKRVIGMTRTIREEAMARLFSQHEFDVKTTLCIADLGCASGPNTFTVVSELILTSERIRQKLNRAQLEYQVYLNDLPGNDFNSVFMSLPKFHQKLIEQAGPALNGQCFVTGLPGSFYGRLLPCQSLQFVHSSYSLYWLSQLPEGTEGNEGNIYLSTKSPPSVVKAYTEQFQKDIGVFLRSRSDELAKGGQMVLTYWGRNTEEPTCMGSDCVWGLFDTVLNQLVSEGVIEEERVESFNIPVYHPSSMEVTKEVEKQGSFFINAVENTQVSFDAQEDNGQNITINGSKMEEKKGDPPSRLMRSVIESVLTCHFGSVVIDEIFQRYSNVVEDVLSKQMILLTNVTISLTKK
uniref:Jasmonate O-methyltransferase n=1 Tax=Opuntia streptacantha TaxID=393608 RepID=A0A7C9ELE9_OPUST